MKKILFCLFVFMIFIGCGKEKENLSFKYKNYLEQETSIKYQSNVELKVENGSIPNVVDIKNIFKEIKKENKNYKNYFMNFYIINKNISLFKLSEIDKEDIKINNAWETLLWDKDIIIDENYNKIGGFVKYSDVNLKINETIDEIYLTLGKTIFEKDGKLVYIIFNKKGQIIGNLYIILNDNKVKDIEFISSNILPENRKQEIMSYFLGDKNIKVKEFDNINGINIRAKDIERKFNIAKQRTGYIGSKIVIENLENADTIIYNQNGFETLLYIKNGKVYKIEVIQTKEKTDEVFSEFQEQLMFAYVLATDDILNREFYNILENLGFSYDKFIINEKYKQKFESGYLRYNFINNGEINIFQIENIN